MNEVKQMLHKVLDSDSAQMISVNQNLMQLSVSNKKRPGFIQMAVDDPTAKGFMFDGGLVGFLLLVSQEDYTKAILPITTAKEP